MFDLKSPLSLANLSEKILVAAKRAGAESADCLVASGSSTNVDVHNGALELAERSEGSDIGLRVFIGKKQAMVSGSDISDRTIEEMAERAIAMAKEAPDDPYAGLATPNQYATAWDIDALELYDTSPEPSAKSLEEEARLVEIEALGHKGIEQVSTASASYSSSEVLLATSNGFLGGYKRTSRSLSCVAIAGTGLGMERDYDVDSRIHQGDLRSAQDIGASAARRTLERRTPRKPSTGVYPVLFDERISSSLIGHLLSAINGASIARGSSWLLDALETQVLPAGMSLIEEPGRPRVGASKPFDAEGLPKQRREIIRDGTLMGWTLDLVSARKLGMSSTASAARSPDSLPRPQAGNVTLSQGEQSKQDLLSDMGTGLLVTSMIGSTINPNTGDYSRGAAGHWVENGKIAYPVSECTIAGNLKDILSRLIAANDARQHLSTRVPSLLVEGMNIAGQ
ncbi:MAG: TldD/PmbA family protein [Paracoccaceae bacterium]|nr:TldD/PmbA family protein [Paracoccaceae bacterium]